MHSFERAFDNEKIHARDHITQENSVLCVLCVVHPFYVYNEGCELCYLHNPTPAYLYIARHCGFIHKSVAYMQSKPLIGGV